LNTPPRSNAAHEVQAEFRTTSRWRPQVASLFTITSLTKTRPCSSSPKLYALQHNLYHPAWWQHRKQVETSGLEVKHPMIHLQHFIQDRRSICTPVFIPLQVGFKWTQAPPGMKYTFWLALGVGLDEVDVGILDDELLSPTCANFSDFHHSSSSRQTV
jgi:hypothetical protein